ncbi:MAG: redoxin domain-containing protein [Pyrinomonadaceae bacterium]|nr:redoxin domain-containing protein [Pyrinomonadaceae bacterium]
MRFLNHHKLEIIIFSLVIGFGALTAIAFKKINEPKYDFGKIITNNKPLPEFNFVDYENKRNYNLEMKQGKILLIYILTTCGGCQNEADIIAQSNLLKDSKIKVYAIGNEKNEAFSEFAKNHNFNFPIFLDEDDKLKNDLVINKEQDISIFPANFVINNGMIERSWFGKPRDLDDLYDKLGVSK